MATTVILPPAAALEAAAAELNASASATRQASITKALYDLLTSKAHIVRVAGAYLVPSTTRDGLIHRLDDLAGCSCEAGRNRRSCRHATAIELIENAQTRTMPRLISPDRAAKLAAAAEAAALLNECF